jgi:hypothetical protein
MPWEAVIYRFYFGIWLLRNWYIVLPKGGSSSTKTCRRNSSNVCIDYKLCIWLVKLKKKSVCCKRLVGQWMVEVTHSCFHLQDHRDTTVRVNVWPAQEDSVLFVPCWCIFSPKGIVLWSWHWFKICHSLFPPTPCLPCGFWSLPYKPEGYQHLFLSSKWTLVFYNTCQP